MPKKPTLVVVVGPSSNVQLTEVANRSAAIRSSEGRTKGVGRGRSSVTSRLTSTVSGTAKPTSDTTTEKFKEHVVDEEVI